MRKSGVIQGKQVAALLPRGGNVLLIEGSGEFSGARARLSGLNESKPANIQAKVVKGDWTELGTHKTVSSWLTLSTSRREPLNAVVSQNDAMAIGARRAKRLPTPTSGKGFLTSCIWGAMGSARLDKNG
jgi:ABC-type sugar transport system substrate-binding protein